MKKVAVLLALVGLSLVVTGYGVACMVNVFTVKPGDTVLAPTATCTVEAHSIVCVLKQGHKRRTVSATVYPKAIFMEVNGNVKYVCFANGQCLKS